MLADIVNAWLGAPVFTPWTIGRIPVDDLDEIFYEIDAKHRWQEAQRQG